MDDRELTGQIVLKIDELNNLLDEAARRGIRIEMDIESMMETGRGIDLLKLSAVFLKMLGTTEARME